MPDGFEKLRDENRSGGLGKSIKEVSDSTVDEDEESRKMFVSQSKYDSGSSVGENRRPVGGWSCAAGAADTQEEAGAMYVGAGCPL